MIVYFVRHASAGERLDNSTKDEKRRLDDEGTLQCRYIGRALSLMDVQPEIILSSPLKRSVQTASAIANELGYEGKIVLEAALRPEAKLEDFLKTLRTHVKAEVVMVVGHRPSIDEFISHLIGMTSGSHLALVMKKGAVARVDLEKRLRGVLQWCITPKMVRALHESLNKSSRPNTSRK
jgi:phosphohistidine phosphatase